jgi:hypothetical protein
MVAGIVIGGLLSLFFLLSLPRVRVKARLGSDERRIAICYSRLCIPLLRKRKAKKTKKEREPRRDRGSGIAWLRLLPGLLNALNRSVRFAARHGRVDEARLSGTIATGDPATTGVVYGALRAADALRDRWMPIELVIEPDFAGERSDLCFTLRASMRTGMLFVSGMIFVHHLPKRRLWRLLRRQRRGRKSTGQT